MTATVPIPVSKIRYVRIIITAYGVGGAAQTTVLLSELEAYGPGVPIAMISTHNPAKQSRMAIHLNGQAYFVPLSAKSAPVRIALFTIGGRCLFSRPIDFSVVPTTLRISNRLAPGSYQCILYGTQGERLSATSVLLNAK